MHAARAVEGDGGLCVARAAFEGLVEAAPGCFAEGLGFEGEEVEGFAGEVHVGDGDGAEVGGYLGDHFWGETEDGFGGDHLVGRTVESFWADHFGEDVDEGC